ncbi:hypothetical protein BJ322DRAFT_1018024 [Thelephora terrestris]|uniref:Uncharacterized protein n=1 Tax=Thelephora terrestris TaxID=56493 RepID=A0A9P6L9F9_9AGAM|nr:hypothetical protein BJ322DRAFT_1018024 [Thelephora terrestris]
MSVFDATTVMLNTAATPFTPSFETDAPYNVEQHLYDTPAAIAQDNEVAIDFLTTHNAPPQFWEEAGYEDPRLDRFNAPHAGARRLLSNLTEAEYNDPIWTRMDRPGVPRLLDAMEREREDRIFRLEKRMDTMHLSSGTPVINAEELIAPTPLASPQSSLRHRRDQGVPLPPSPPWSPAPVCQMVERSQKRKNRKNPMTRSGQRCRPSDKSRQVRMKLKVEVAGLQDRYGFALILIVDPPLQGVPELLLDRMLQLPEPTPHLEDHLLGDHGPDPELIVPGQPHQMWDRLPETFGVHLLDDLQDLEAISLTSTPKERNLYLEEDVSASIRSPRSPPYLVIRGIGNPRFIGVGLAVGGTAVDTGDGGYAVGDFVGMVVWEGHVGKMMGKLLVLLIKDGSKKTSFL